MKPFTPEERKQWEERRDQQNDALLTRLAEGIASLGDEPAWKAWLVNQRKFHQYSASNVLLLAIQCAERDMPLNRVAGYGTWAGMGRQVRKGETGLTVFAPMKVKVGSGAEETKFEKDEDDSRLLFKAVRVFEESQTIGKPLPEPVQLLNGEDINGSFGRLQKVAESEGLTVTREELTGGIRGYYQSATHKIVVDRNLSGAQSVKTICHELGHYFLEHKSYAEGSREDFEMEAESVAFIVAGDDLIGINSSEYSFGYIASWQGGAKEAVQKIKESTGRIQQASKKITERLDRVIAEGDVVDFEAELDVARRSFQQRQEAFRPRGEGRTR